MFVFYFTPWRDWTFDVRPARNAFGWSWQNVLMSRPGDNAHTTIVCDAWQAGVGRSSFKQPHMA
jgi:hypothetical protein